jgi:AcrR family transcriptional regulator
MCPAAKVSALLGRPRDDKRDEAIQSAAIELMQEVGYERCTIEAIAARAHASKATIYRRWNNKQELILSAVTRHTFCSPPEIDSGNLRVDLIEMISEKIKNLKGPDGAIVSVLLTAAKNDPELGKLIPTSIRETQDDSVMHIIERGIKRGEISKDANIELLLEILPGIFTYRIFMTHQSVNRKFIEQLVDGILIPSLQSKKTTKESK